MKKCIIVDDSKLSRKIVSELLEIIGYKCECELKDGAGIVEAYESVKPDLITIDMQMPNVDGVEAVKMLCSVYPEATVLMITSVVDKKRTLLAIKSGAKAVLTKPINEQRLRDAIDGIL
jgi:two-component system chemotaxis response regulator CheY